MNNAEKLRARYADRKARGVCVDCQAPSLGKVRCADCRARLSVQRRLYDKANPEDARNRMKRLYWENPEKFRARERQRRLDKKLRGECARCSSLALPDCNLCARHVELERVRRNTQRERKQLGLPPRIGGVRPGTVRSRTIPCDCGAPAVAGSDRCARCAHLDGDGRQADIVAALRLSDGMSLLELCEALDMDTGLKNGRRQMWRWVKDLLEQGRVRRYWRESTGTDEHAVFGGGKALNAIGCWAYALDGKTEREWRRHAA